MILCGPSQISAFILRVAVVWVGLVLTLFRVLFVSVGCLSAAKVYRWLSHSTECRNDLGLTHSGRPVSLCDFQGTTISQDGQDLGRKPTTSVLRKMTHLEEIWSWPGFPGWWVTAKGQNDFKLKSVAMKEHHCHRAFCASEWQKLQPL